LPGSEEGNLMSLHDSLIELVPGGGCTSTTSGGERSRGHEPVMKAGEAA